MNNEETILDSQLAGELHEKSNSSVEPPKAEEKKYLGRGEKVAYAAGGAVVGAGMTMAEQAAAASKVELHEVEKNKVTDAEEAESVGAIADAEDSQEHKVATDEVTGVTIEANGTTFHVIGDARVDIENGTVHVSSIQTMEEQHAVPEPEDAIVATATGVRVAQVDDNASFSQAFADARAQVGPGGVFEWHGRVYGTYYKDEWDNMTAEQKHEYQASIDYKDVISNERNVTHQDGSAHNASYQEGISAELDSREVPSEDMDVHVLEVGQTDLNSDGVPENAAILEFNGHEILLVDIDRNGMADIALCDVDGDGQIEYRDLTDENIGMPDLSDGDAYLAQANDAPDYMNDANVGLYEA